MEAGIACRPSQPVNKYLKIDSIYQALGCRRRCRAKRSVLPGGAVKARSVGLLSAGFDDRVRASRRPVFRPTSSVRPLADGALLVAGRAVTGFSWTEEVLAGVASKMPYNAEAEMTARGAICMKAPIPFAPHVVADGRLVTGQNPFSARATAERFALLLRSVRSGLSVSRPPNLPPWRRASGSGRDGRFRRNRYRRVWLRYPR